MANKHSTVERNDSHRGAAPAPAGNFSKATELLNLCADDVFALDDIGRRFAGNPFTPLTMAQVVSALAESIRTKLAECNKLLPGPMVHPAHIDTGEAHDVLTALDEFMVTMTNDADLRASEATVGMVIVDMTVKAARAIARAGLACGAPRHMVSTATYLDADPRDPSQVHAGSIGRH